MRSITRNRALTSFALCSLAASLAGAAQGQETRPNILLIVADDMGMADLGSFGSEIATPHLDRLAEQGVRLANFHASSVCSPTRAMLLTGVDNHLAGLGNMAEELAPNQEGRPGYEGHLNDRVVTIAELLGAAGYDTFMTGKWHLGAVEGSLPVDRGFDRSFSMLSGGASHFDDMRPAYSPDPDGKAPYTHDGQRLDRLPESFDYSSQFFVDQMIEFIEDREDPEHPFFAYLAFTAPHWPLQAPAETIAKYRARYDAGYDVLAAERLARQKEIGILPDNADAGSSAPKYIPWSDLSDAQRRTDSRAMEIYAAMIDEMDRHTGRLIERLEDLDELDDTVIVFLSDNGPEGHDLDETWPRDLFPEIRANIEARHDFSFENMGAPNSYVLYGPGWAMAGSPGLSLFKGFPTEGGTRVPAFITFEGAASGRISHAFHHVTDVAPTLLELAGVTQPDGMFEGRVVEPIEGTSMVASLSRTATQPATETPRVAGEILGKSFVREGKWKAVHMPPPHGNGAWQLFDLAADPGETTDVADANPETVDDLLSAWGAYVARVGVITPDWVSGY